MVDREVIKTVRFSPDEMRMIQEKMRQFGTTNFSAFVRKMALDGYVVKLELPELKDIERLATPKNSFPSMNRKSYCIRRQSSFLMNRG